MSETTVLTPLQKRILSLLFMNPGLTAGEIYEKLPHKHYFPRAILNLVLAAAEIDRALQKMETDKLVRKAEVEGPSRYCLKSPDGYRLALEMLHGDGRG